LEHPIWAQFPPYFGQRKLAGRFLPSPFFPPDDRIRVKTLFGHKWRRVHRGAPPAGMEDYPQFQNRDHIWVGK
jgi:type IV secretion system protein VirD4